MADGGDMLEVRDLHAGYGPAEVLAGVSLAVRRGTVVALLGADGAGKTTTLRVICGVIAPTRGAVLLEGKPIHGLGAARVARLGVARSPESREELAPRSIEENLLLGASPWLPRLFGFRKKAAPDLERVYGLFPRLAERRTQLAATLSGGELQLLAIGRALMARPRVLLLDEPSTGLAPSAVQEVFAIIARLKAEGATVLLVERLARAALQVADRACVMARGRIALEGTPAELLGDERRLAAYLG